MKKFASIFPLILSLFILFIFSFSAQASVWENKNKWDRSWEKKYQQWVKRNWKEEFFMNPNKPIYYKFSNDCADATYMMRLVFSYEHGLPFVINNAHKRGKLMTNNMKNWDRLAPEKRVRAFMDYVANFTSTQSLKQDTYPIALADIKPGDLYVAPGVHSYQIINVTETGIAEVMFSTTPKAPRFLDRSASFPFYVPEGKNDGYRRFKAPQHIRLATSKQPDYNNEQYRLAASVGHNYVKFTDIIAKRLGRRPEKPAEKTLRLLIALCMYANDRSVYVYEALWHLQKIRRGGRRCMNRTEYNNYSTPGRDKRLRAFFDSVKQHVRSSRNQPAHLQSTRWSKAVFANQEPSPAAKKDVNSFCMVQMSLGEKYFMTLRNLRKNVDAKTVVSDPHAPLDYRWGIQKKSYKASCKTY